MPSLRALWKIDLCQVSSLVKYCRNKNPKHTHKKMSKVSGILHNVNIYKHFQSYCSKTHLLHLLARHNPSIRRPF